MKSNQINDYIIFLEILNKKLETYFDSQKEYIHCKEGCSLCCREGEYPCSELEYEFLRIGFSLLPLITQQKIINNVIEIKNERKNFKGETFVYKCPFLIEDRCSIYNYRMIICRTFGLSYYIEDENGDKRIKNPFCIEKGLNYSEVFDTQRKIISDELYKEKGFKNEPVAFNLSLKFLLNRLGHDGMDLDFGEEKALIDWL